MKKKKNNRGWWHTYYSNDNKVILEWEPCKYGRDRKENPPKILYDEMMVKP